MLPIFEPYLSEREHSYVEDCLRTNWISSQGSYITRFEELLAAYHGVGHAVATSNCTTALHLALAAMGIGPGDEVICPALTFIAPANMIELAGARVVLADIDPETLNIDPEDMARRITQRTKAVIAVHQFGHAAPMDEIGALARTYGLRVIEDNAESPGGRYRGQLLGTLGDAACYSFFGNKILTTGEGGAVITDDPELAGLCRVLRDHGMSRERRYHHVALGFNYRMTNLQAAVGVGQMERVEEILDTRRRQLARYESLLDGLPGLSVRKFADWCEPVHWMMTVTLDEELDRDALLAFLRINGVDGRQMVNPVHHAEHFRSRWRPEEFPVAVDISRRSLHLPSSLTLTDDAMDRVAAVVREWLAESSR